MQQRKSPSGEGLSAEAGCPQPQVMELQPLERPKTHPGKFLTNLLTWKEDKLHDIQRLLPALMILSHKTAHRREPINAASLYQHLSEIRLECQYMQIVAWGKDAHIPGFQGCCKEPVSSSNS